LLNDFLDVFFARLYIARWHHLTLADNFKTLKANYTLAE